MERVEFAPDDELGEKLSFEWPEETGLTLDDFEVYKYWHRDYEYRFHMPLFVAVCEPSSCTRRLIEPNFSTSLFVVINKNLNDIRNVHFVRAPVDDRTLNVSGWHAPIITPRHRGYVFSDARDAVRFQMRGHVLLGYQIFPETLKDVEHYLIPIALVPERKKSEWYRALLDGGVYCLTVQCPFTYVPTPP